MIHARVLALCACLAGCDRVWNLQDPIQDAPADAPCSSSATDEDGDCHDNVADNCPGLPGSQADGDGDGVGDLCDPNPELGGDRILEFESFDDPAAATRWRDASPESPWTLADGIARHASTTDVTALYQRTIPVDAAVVTIEVELEFTAWAAGTPQATPATTHLGVLVDGTADLPTGHSCRVDPADGPAGTPSGAHVIVGDGTQSQTSAITPPAISQRVRIRLQRRTADGELRCSLSIDDAPPTQLMLARGGAVWPADRRVGVNAPGAAAALHYVTIYVAD